MKVNAKQIKIAIARTIKAKQDGQKTTILWSVKDGEIYFSGHNWAHNCAYSVEDMKRNGDFKMIDNPETGVLEPIGCDWELSQDDLDKIIDLELWARKVHRYLHEIGKITISKIMSI